MTEKMLEELAMDELITTLVLYASIRYNNSKSAVHYTLQFSGASPYMTASNERR